VTLGQKERDLPHLPFQFAWPVAPWPVAPPSRLAGRPPGCMSGGGEGE